MIVARFQSKGIKLENMKNWQSMDWGVYDGVKIYDGVCASTNLGYIWTLIDKWVSVDVLGEGLDPDKVEWGEIVVMDADDTGVRCHDGEPIVKVNEILERIDAREFYDEELTGEITESLLKRELVIV